MGRRYDTISFLSDLGLTDEHVGVAKAIVRDLAPHAVVVDLTHAIPPYDVRAGSLALARAIGYVPSGVVMAVVAAGERRAVAIEVAGGEGVVIGPDNGLLASAVSMAGGAGRAVVLDNADFQLASPGVPVPSRDVFAAVAAHLCNGVDLAELGTPVDADAILPGVVPLPREADGGGVHAEVLWIDHAGNCQLNIGLDDVAPWGSAEGVRLQVSAGDITRVAQRARRRRPRPRVGGPRRRWLRPAHAGARSSLGGRRAGARRSRPGHAAAVGRWRQRPGCQRARGHAPFCLSGRRAACRTPVGSGTPGSVAVCALRPRSPSACCCSASSLPASSPCCGSDRAAARVITGCRQRAARNTLLQRAWFLR